MTNCLEDPGSQITLITERLVDSLDIQRRKGNLVLSGIGNQNLRLQDEVALEVSPDQIRTLSTKRKRKYSSTSTLRTVMIFSTLMTTPNFKYYNVRSRIYDAHFVTSVIKVRHHLLPRRITRACAQFHCRLRNIEKQKYGDKERT